MGRLQIERGVSAIFLSSNKSNIEAFRSLSQAWRHTDAHMVNLRSWTSLVLPDSNVTLHDVEQFRTLLNNYRIDLLISNVTITRNILFFTEINTAFLDSIAASVSFSGQDKLLVAFNSLLRAADASGIQRALGSTYFLPCEFSKPSRDWFYRLEATVDMYLGEVFKYHEASLILYTEGLDDLVPLAEVIQSTSNSMLDEQYTEYCKVLPLDQRYDMSVWWFDNMTSYIGLMTNIRDGLITTVHSSLLTELERTQRKSILYSVIMALVLLASVATLYLVNKMTAKIQDYVMDILDKTLLLEQEKKLTEGLLYQVFPHNIHQFQWVG